MRRIWLPNGEPGLERNGDALGIGTIPGTFRFVGRIATSASQGGIPFRHRHAIGFEVDKMDRRFELIQKMRGGEKKA